MFTSQRHTSKEVDFVPFGKFIGRGFNADVAESVVVRVTVHPPVIREEMHYSTVSVGGVFDLIF